MVRPPKKAVARYHDFIYRTASWDRERRVMAKVEWDYRALGLLLSAQS